MNCFRSKVQLNGRKRGKKWPQEKQKNLNSTLIYFNPYLFKFCLHMLKGQEQAKQWGFVL